MRKTFNSFVCLLVLMLVSFIASSYQLKPVDYGPAPNNTAAHKKHHHHHKKENITSMMSRHASNLIEQAKNIDVTDLYQKAKEVDLAKWKRDVLTKTQYGEPFLRFVLTTIISLGALLKIIYLSYGMAGLPMYLIKGTRSLESENEEI